MTAKLKDPSQQIELKLNHYSE